MPDLRWSRRVVMAINILMWKILSLSLRKSPSCCRRSLLVYSVMSPVLQLANRVTIHTIRVAPFVFVSVLQFLLLLWWHVVLKLGLLP